MKRLNIGMVALLIVLLFAPASASAVAATRITSVDTGAIVGMTVQNLVKQYGNPTRTEPSEYGFTWYVYNRDYANFLMAGVQGGKVVAVYTDAKTQKYGSAIRLNSTRDAVRAKLGKPIAYLRAGNTIYFLPNSDQKDVFVVGADYVLAFYDVIAGGKVTALMIVPKVLEDKAVTTHPALSAGLVSAYQRISMDLVNAARVRAGLDALRTDGQDAMLAVSRSKDMRDRNYFSHYTPEGLSPFDLARKMGIRYSAMGENIAYGNRNAILAHESFMNSAGHRSNILKSQYTKIGSGVAYGGKRYVILTNIFSR